jgi:hypothetical protein
MAIDYSLGREVHFIPDAELDVCDAALEVEKPPAPLSLDELAELAYSGRTAKHYSIGIAALSLAGAIGAGIGAIESIISAPPAHIETSVLNARDYPGSRNVIGLDIAPKLNKLNMTTHFGLASVKIPRHLHMFGENIGANTQVDLSNLSITDAKGNFDVAKITQYGEYFSNFSSELNRISSQVKNYYEGQALDGAETALEIETAALLLFIAFRRYTAKLDDPDRETVHEFVSTLTKRVGMAAAVIAACTIVTGSVAHPDTPPEKPLIADSIFDGTPLAGSEISPSLRTVVDKVAPLIEKFIMDYDRYDRTALASYTSEIASLYGTDKLPKRKGTIRFYVTDDYQGRSILQRVAGHIANNSNVDYFLVDGDMTFSGTKYETISVNSLANAFDNPHNILVATSEHDSDDIRDLERKAGMRVNNKDHLVQIGKLKATIADLPLRAPFGGAPAYETTPGGIATFTKDLIARACKEKPFLLITHDKTVGNAVAKTGCVRFVSDGRSYQPMGPRSYIVPGVGKTSEYTSGSSGALTADAGPSFKLPDPLSISYQGVVDYDPATDTLTYQRIDVDSNGIVNLSPEKIMGTPTELSNLSDAQLVIQQSLRPGSESLADAKYRHHR